MTKEQKLYELWLEQTGDDPEVQKELKAIAGKDEEILDRFYQELSFGTAGLRGVLGMGTNRMNCYVVGRATQGLAGYLQASGVKEPSAAIAYDSRLCSEEFARHTACVFAANGVKVHLYQELMPTPALSYAVRELGCDTGVVITASHNPASYNGYKAYDNQGCQIGQEQADMVQKGILSTDLFTGVKAMDFEEALATGMIQYIPEDFVQQYLDRVLQEALEPEVCKQANLSLVYTPLNGAGNRCVRTVLERVGVTNITIVSEQEHPDGHFPTCPYPNPELRPALELGIALAEEKKADLLLATDPDADRVAVAVRHQGEYRITTGNELGILLLEYICKTRAKLGKLPDSPVAVRSLVSSRMTDAVAAHYGVEMRRVLTGFKYVGETIAQLEAENRGDSFIFAFEESCGYLSAGYVRDKDAIDASMLAVEMASAYKLEGKTLIDALEELYERFGFWRTEVDSFTFEGASGMQAMKDIMESLRENPPSQIGGHEVTEMLDYQRGEKIVAGSRSKEPLPQTNMIELRLKGDHSVIVRPSGTEPKIKVYYTLIADSHQATKAILDECRSACKALILPNA